MLKQSDDIQCCVTHCAGDFDQHYWNERWQKNETGWDTGEATPPLTNYLAQVAHKGAAILIPGSGNAHEADYMLTQGFTNITLIDIAPLAAKKLEEKFAGYPQVKVLCEDFFLHEGSYDLIIEQTFFCAIPPTRRKDYAVKTSALLKPGGKLVGVLFDKQFDQAFPPFGGCPCEYKPLFAPFFHLTIMEECYNSISPRAKSELFINFLKK